MFHVFLFKSLHTTPRRHISLTQAAILSSAGNFFATIATLCNNMRPQVKNITIVNVFASVTHSKGWFPMSRNFYVRTCVKFSFANKIARERKSWTSLNFSFKLSTFYLASILFTWLRFTCVNVRKKTRQWKSTLPDLSGNTCFLQQVQKVTSVRL